MRAIIAFFFAFTLAYVIPAYAVTDQPLASPYSADKMAAMHNEAGVKAYLGDDYAGAETHFREAIKLAPKFAEAHFNLALSLHGQDKHKESAVEFKIAANLAPHNKAIADSALTKKHLKM